MFMRFAVRRLRYKGRLLPKHEWMNRPPAIGDLRVEQVFDEELRRYLRLARVVSVGRVKDPDELPPLYGKRSPNDALDRGVRASAA